MKVIRNFKTLGRYGRSFSAFTKTKQINLKTQEVFETPVKIFYVEIEFKDIDLENNVITLTDNKKIKIDLDQRFRVEVKDKLVIIKVNPFDTEKTEKITHKKFIEY